MLLLYHYALRGIHGVFVGIHGVYICIGYVSVMYRLCVGNVTEHTSSEGVNKEDNIDNYSYLAFARTIITVAPTSCHGEGKYLSTMETIIFNNKNNK